MINRANPNTQKGDSRLRDDTIQLGNCTGGEGKTNWGALTALSGLINEKALIEDWLGGICCLHNGLRFAGSFQAPAPDVHMSTWGWGFPLAGIAGTTILEKQIIHARVVRVIAAQGSTNLRSSHASPVVCSPSLNAFARSERGPCFVFSQLS